VFQSDRDGDFEIYVMNSNGQNVVQLTDNAWVDRLAAWSPDGEWVIFSSDVRGDGNFDLYRVRSDGTQLEEVFTSAARKSHPRYSPDGRYIIFTSGSANDAATWEIMRLDTTSGEILQMTNNSRRDASPLFSPNGARILFITMMSDGSNNALAEMNIDGTDAQVIYNSAGSDWSANYSPDGRYIVFSSNLTGSDQIYLMTADGTHVQQVTTTRGGYPSWLPESE
jgi:TolB protein